jgi:hypothetical protein
MVVFGIPRSTNPHLAGFSISEFSVAEINWRQAAFHDATVVQFHFLFQSFKTKRSRQNSKGFPRETQPLNTPSLTFRHKVDVAQWASSAACSNVRMGPNWSLFAKASWTSRTVSGEVDLGIGAD